MLWKSHFLQETFKAMTSLDLPLINGVGIESYQIKQSINSMIKIPNRQGSLMTKQKWLFI
ncbi:hypothetical protein swp_3587 [Shewanella piezotolerans WP3]|uniref:Uncharacterized protein n=1 Tax=Shewanella piezotolerans (strain WP3 / JCM 13877) TaxID=225849 RepID=B8CQE8_SHEPW|nr:hypothetical protein swp_3587 [Shewanella piezotolerans WP3]